MTEPLSIHEVIYRLVRESAFFKTDSKLEHVACYDPVYGMAAEFYNLQKLAEDFPSIIDLRKTPYSKSNEIHIVDLVFDKSTELLYCASIADNFKKQLLEFKKFDVYTAFDVRRTPDRICFSICSMYDPNHADRTHVSQLFQKLQTQEKLLIRFVIVDLQMIEHYFISDIYYDHVRLIFFNRYRHGYNVSFNLNCIKVTVSKNVQFDRDQIAKEIETALKDHFYIYDITSDFDECHHVTIHLDNKFDINYNSRRIREKLNKIDEKIGVFDND